MPKDSTDSGSTAKPRRNTAGSGENTAAAAPAGAGRKRKTAAGEGTPAGDTAGKAQTANKTKTPRQATPPAGAKRSARSKTPAAAALPGKGTPVSSGQSDSAVSAKAKADAEPKGKALDLVKAEQGKSASTEGKGWGPLAAGEKLLARMRREKTVSPADVLRQIAEGPTGPDVIAAFDFDGTLVGGLTGAMLFQERMRRKDIKQAELTDNLVSTAKAVAKRMEGHEVITRGFTHWAGKTEEEMEELAAHLFENKIQDLIFPEMREILDAHRKAGHTIVVATAATRFQVQRVVEALGVDHLLCTEVEIVDGKLTGKLVGESLFGPGKIEALRRFIAERGCDFADTHFYADGEEEIALMETVGNPHPVNPSRKLADAAKVNGWPVLRLQSRGGTKAANYVRNIAGLLAVMPIAQAGLAVGLLTRDKRQVANLIMPTWIQAQLDLAGVKLRVSGRKNLHARRPALFIYNHRNNYDGMFVALLVRTDVAGVGKKEMAQNPIGKLGTMIVPTILVERGGGDKSKAAEALRPAVEAVENGYSILIAPEGTRVKGHPNAVGPFKKGAFHMAMAAKIPIVPIVVRNALDVASRDGPMRPGTVDIAVLPPVPIDDWTPANMAEKIEQVRELFVATLADWPEPDEEQ